MLQLKSHEVGGHRTLLVILDKLLRHLGDLALDDEALDVDCFRVNLHPELSDLSDDLVVVVQRGHTVLLHAVAVVQCLRQEGGPTEPSDCGPVRRLLILGNIIQRLNSGYICVDLLTMMKFK